MAGTTATLDEHWSDLLARAPVPVIALDSRFVVLFVNPAATRLLGTGGIGASVSTIICPQPQESLVALLAAAWNGETVPLFEAQLKRANGSCVDIEAAVWKGRGVLLLSFLDITERKSATSALCDALETQRALIAASPLPIVVITSTGVITTWNAAAERAFGWTAAEVLGHPLPFIPLEKMAEHRAMRAQDLSGQAICEREIQRLRKDGGPIDLRVSTGPICDARGRVTGIISIYQDITGTKRIERALRESNQRFERFMSHLPGAAWIKDLNGHYVYANPEAERIFRVPLDELRGKTDEEVFPAETAAQFRGNDERAIEHGSVQTTELLEQEDGVHESVVNKFSIPDEHGRPALVGGIAIDITDRLRAEHALKESQERLDLATRAARIGTFDWDIAHGRLVWNEQQEAIFGLAPGSFEGTFEAWEKRVHPEDRAAVAARINETIAQRASDTTCAYRILHSGAGIRWIEGTARFIYDAGGTPQRAVGVNVDMTERREAERALHQANEQLRRANEDLEQFAYSASHDLREPLRSIGSFAQLLELKYAGRLDQDADEYLQYLTTSARRMADLLNDLLAYTSAATLDVIRPPLTDANMVVRRVVGTLAPALQRRNAQITIETLPTVRVHEMHLTQMFQNLLSNSIKYAKPGEDPVVHISAARQDGAWRFSVRDQGIGVAPRHHQRIFGLFRRLHADTEGTGLGLALCKKIVERYGGRIWVESAEGDGATFQFTLPE
ncbi:MAG: PAS domain S-box protein [Acidobacteria bacterium]|nr:PAS domain S-box protein [Acidobacteriota bacterium]